MTATALQQSAPFAVERLTGTLGAEISGIDIRDSFTGAQVNALKALLVEHKVIFFREQDSSIEAFLRFALLFGEPEPYSLGPLRNLVVDPVHRDIAVLESQPTHAARADVWHSDLSFQKAPSFGSILRCVTAPAVGGDTMWTDMEAAYAGLDAEMRARLLGLTAVHDWRAQITSARARGIPESDIQALVAAYPPREHPVVRTHPVSGRKCLYVNPAFTKYIVGMEEAESRALLDRLFTVTSRPEYQVRFRWRANSIAFWDNRSTQHYAVLDYVGQYRRMERVTFKGEEVR